MFRRYISILALLGFLAGQLAVVPHAHGGSSPEQQREHDAQPHVHIGLSGHYHDHCLSQDGHSHHHATDTASVAAENERLLNNLRAAFPHDADAIYLPTGAGTPTPVKDQRSASDSLATSPGLTPNPFCALTEPHPLAAPHHPPDSDCAGVKLILKLRTLRI